MISSIPSKKKKRKIQHTTFKGRVVYDRKPHKFEARDLLRIAKRMEGPDDVKQMASLIATLPILIITLLRGVMEAMDYAERAETLWNTFRAVIGAFRNGLRSELGETLQQDFGYMQKPTAESAALEGVVYKYETVQLETLGDLWYWTDPVTGFKWERSWNGKH